MIKNDIFSTIVESYHLSEEINDLKRQTDQWISNGGNISPNDKLAAVYQSLIESAKQALNQAEIIQILTDFKKYLQSLPVLEMTIAFEPDEAFKAEVTKKLVSALKGDFVVDIRTDSDLIAGCVIRYQGKFGDYSILKQLEENKDNIFGPILKEIH